MTSKEGLMISLTGFINHEGLWQGTDTMKITRNQAQLIHNTLSKEMLKEAKEMADGIYNPTHQEEGKNHVICCEHDLEEETTMSGLCNDDLVTKASKLWLEGDRKIRCLFDTAAPMCSCDEKTRFVAEYYQTKIRYEKLKALNTRIEAADRTNGKCYIDWAYAKKDDTQKVERPKHDCPDNVLLEQQRVMGEYLHILELRAVIEGIDLEQYK